METVEYNNSVADAHPSGVSDATPAIGAHDAYGACAGADTHPLSPSPSRVQAGDLNALPDEAAGADGYYKSQKEVDRAFAKRIAAEREKWERERQQGMTGGNTPEAGDALGFYEEADFLRSVQQGESRIREIDPAFDLAAEMERNPMFALMVAQGEDVKKVYDFFNPQVNERRLRAAVEQQIIQRLRMRNNRPEALRSANAGNVHRDISSMSDNEIMEIDKRIKRGERVVL